MELLPLVCLCVLTWSGTTFAGPEIIRLTEGSDVTLPCSVSVDVTSKKFVWMKDGQKEVFVYDSGVSSSKGLSGQHEQFKGRVSYFGGELKNGNASISIRNTKVSDSGNYTCELKLTPNQKFHIRLLVDGPLKDRRGEAGAAPKPSVTSLNRTEDWELLQCEVQGAFPKPKVQWQDRAGNILIATTPQVSERGGTGYDIVLQTTAYKTDYYRCVATQEEIKHQVYAEIYVNFNGERNTSWTALIKFIIGVLCFAVVVLGGILCINCLRKRR